MAPTIGRGRRSKGKLKGYHEWKKQQGAGRDTSRGAYEKYKTRWHEWRAVRLEEQEEAAVAEAVAAVQARKAAEQPMLGKREWAKQQPPGAATDEQAYAQYQSDWTAARAALEAAEGCGGEEEEGRPRDDEATAAAAAAAAEVRRQEAHSRWGALFMGAY